MSFRTLWFEDGALHLLDQRRLPAQVEIVQARTARETAQAIREMIVRGAPAIGCAAAYGLALAVRSGENFAEARSALLDSRPTAVNLRWAVERLSAVQPRTFEALRGEADRVLAEDYLSGLAEAPLDEVRSLRDEAEQEEVDLSYIRRLIQGRMDIVRQLARLVNLKRFIARTEDAAVHVTRLDSRLTDADERRQVECRIPSAPRAGK